MGQRGHEQLSGHIRIHAGDPIDESVEHRLDAWERELQPVMAQGAGHSFEVLLWKRKPDGPDLHDRYILTDQCGVSVPGGLDCSRGPTARHTDWSLLDHDVHLRRLRDYDPTHGLYQLIGRREILTAAGEQPHAMVQGRPLLAMDHGASSGSVRTQVEIHP